MALTRLNSMVLHPLTFGLMKNCFIATHCCELLFLFMLCHFYRESDVYKNVCLATGVGSIVGFCVGGRLGAKVAGKDHILANQLTPYKFEMQAHVSSCVLLVSELSVVLLQSSLQSMADLDKILGAQNRTKIVRWATKL